MKFAGAFLFLALMTGSAAMAQSSPDMTPRTSITVAGCPVEAPKTVDGSGADSRTPSECSSTAPNGSPLSLLGLVGLGSLLAGFFMRR